MRLTGFGFIGFVWLLASIGFIGFVALFAFVEFVGLIGFILNSEKGLRRENNNFSEKGLRREKREMSGLTSSRSRDLRLTVVRSVWGMLFISEKGLRREMREINFIEKC